MSVYAKQLHYIKDGAQNDIKLYTSLSDVVDVNINPDGTTGGITLYTSPQDVGYENPTLSLYTSPDDTGYPCARLMDGDTPVYVSLEELTSSNANVSGLRMSAGGTTYIVKKNALPIKGKASYTPEEIKQIVNAGKHTEYFNVGDSILPVTLNGTVGIQTFNNETYYATILGFDHNKELESNGKNSIHFILGKNAGDVDIAFCDSKYNTNVENAAAFHMNMTNTNGGWNGSYMRGTILPQLKAALPSSIQGVISNVTKYSDNTGGANDTASYVTATTDDVFLLSEYEVQGAKTYANSAEQSKQKQYAYYANGASKVRYKHSDASSAVWWWLRSASYYAGARFCIVGTGGGADRYGAYISGGFVPCFAIVAD